MSGPRLRIALVNCWDTRGGAARAVLRLHRFLLEAGHDCTLLVQDKYSDDPTVRACPDSWSQRLGRELLRPVVRAIRRRHRRAHASYASYNLYRTGVGAAIDRLAPDVVHLHWLGHDTLSIGQIGRVRRPTVWTMHDMWPFCGVMHYDGTANAIWRNGYDRGRDGRARGDDAVEQLAWARKARAWRAARFEMVAPTAWLADCARESALLGRMPVTVIPNPMDLRTFRPYPGEFARAELGLPMERPLLLFGADGGTRDPRKGWSLLVEALALLPESLRRRAPLCCIFGQAAPDSPVSLPLEARWLGRIEDDRRLALCYSAADVTVVPSLLDNLAQTGTEAQACGCPVATFGATGTRDIVEDGVTGFLAQTPTAAGLAAAIARSIESGPALRDAARARAERLWAPATVIEQYERVYADARRSAPLP